MLVPIFVVSSIGVFLLFLLVSSYVRTEKKKETEKPPQKGSRTCPICGSILLAGERVKSFVYPGTTDRVTHIFGCPHCYPFNPLIDRICPVCKEKIPASGYVLGRLFERPYRKSHLHVTGCTSCRKPRR